MSSADLQARLAATVAALDGHAAVDAQLDPGGAVDAVARGGTFWLRASNDPRPVVDGGAYGPPPGASRWLRLDPARAEVTLLASDGAPGSALRVVSIATRVARASWGTSAAPFAKVIARAVLVTEGEERLVFASAIADDEDAARAALAPAVTAIARALGVEADGAIGAAVDPPADEDDRAPAGAVGAPRLARFTLGWEGDRLVLRDLTSRGPRESAVLWGAVVVGALLGAVAASVALVLSVRAGAPWTAVALRAGVTAVFVLGAFAFFHVARHAWRYRAEGAPVAVFADDRVVVAPWVGRDGAVDPRPEGRFGAGVRAAEVHRVHVEPRDGLHAVSLDTAHGPIDVATLDDPAEADLLREVVERSLSGVASPVRRKTSLMRGRERAAAAS